MTPGVVLASAVLGAACGPRLRAVIFWHASADGEPRRHCPHCGCRLLAGPDRSPVVPARPDRRLSRLPLSRLPMSGLCPSCQDRLGPAAGCVETATAAVFAVLAARAHSVPLLVALCWFAAVGVALAAVDTAVYRLPDRLTAAAGVGLLVTVGPVAVVDHRYGALLHAVLGGLGLFAGYLALLLVHPSSLGFGDCKLAAGLGTVLGWFGWPEVFAGTLLAFVLAAGYGLVRIALGRAGRRDPLPFGPFLLVGALAGVLTG